METTRTTVNLPSVLLDEAKQFALSHRITVTNLIKESLELRLRSPRAPSPNRSLSSFLAHTRLFSVVPPKEAARRYRQHLEEKYG